MTNRRVTPFTKLSPRQRSILILWGMVAVAMVAALSLLS